MKKITTKSRVAASNAADTKTGRGSPAGVEGTKHSKHLAIGKEANQLWQRINTEAESTVACFGRRFGHGRKMCRTCGMHRLCEKMQMAASVYLATIGRELVFALAENKASVNKLNDQLIAMEEAQQSKDTKP
jgi:hypothetical protein